MIEKSDSSLNILSVELEKCVEMLEYGYVIMTRGGFQKIC